MGIINLILWATTLAESKSGIEESLVFPYHVVAFNGQCDLYPCEYTEIINSIIETISQVHIRVGKAAN